MFMKLSQLTRWPLNVSPFLSSTSCLSQLCVGRLSCEVRGRGRTMGLFWAAFSRESGSYVDGGISGIWERKKKRMQTMLMVRRLRLGEMC